MRPDVALNRGCVVSAATRSSGKSVVSIGLAAAARNRHWPIQCFKKGPDYIDPLWLSAASGQSCINLDPILQLPEELQHTFNAWRARGGFSLVEGSMGLHDGLLDDFSDSNAALSRHLDLPTLLVVDGEGMNRTIASVVNGLVNFDSQVQYQGVVLNRVKTARHEQKLCDAISRYTDLEVLGVVPYSPRMHIDEKALGLVPAVEVDSASATIEAITDIVTGGCDIDRIFAPGNERDIDRRPDMGTRRADARTPPEMTANKTFRVALAKDDAFQFYYHDDLHTLAAHGVDLVEVSPLDDTFPGDIDGLILGGGFPERHASKLSTNTAFIEGLRCAVSRGLAVRAECGGLMYLSRSMRIDEQTFPLAGIIPGDVMLHAKPVGRGYVQLESILEYAEQHHDEPHGGDEKLIPAVATELAQCNAHEFHYSSLDLDTEVDVDFLFKVNRGHGIDGEHDGIRIHNVVASYAHQRHTARTPWVDEFIDQLMRARAAMASEAQEKNPEHV